MGNNFIASVLGSDSCQPKDYNNDGDDDDDNTVTENRSDTRHFFVAYSLVITVNISVACFKTFQQ